jgi:S-layer protein
MSLTNSQVDTMYVDLLARHATAAEIATWVALSATQTTAQIEAQIEALPEVAAFVEPVIRLYQGAFGRVPDTSGGLSSGFAVNVNALRSGVSVPALAEAFTVSPEFLAIYGSNAVTPALISAYYQHILGRSATTAEINAWSSAHLDAAQILVGVTQSAEYTAESLAAVKNFETALLNGGHPTGTLQGNLPPPPPPVETHTLTVGQDTVHGVAGDVVIVNAPMAGVFGNQNTLTDFDSLVANGPGGANPSILNASIDGHTNINGVTIKGFQIYNFVDDGFGTVTINGGGSAASPAITGVNQVNFNANGGGGSLNLGTALLPVDVAGDLAGGFTVGISNALGGFGHHIDVAFGAAVLTGTESMTVNAFSVGNAADNDLDNAYGIAAGGTGPHSNGFASWTLNSTGATLGTVNDIALGGEGQNSATSFVGTDDGSTTVVYASKASGSTAGDWANIVTVDLTGTSGNWTITGGETDADGNGAGFLSADTTAFTTFLGGSGTYLLDLSSYVGTGTGANADNLGALHINGGTGAGVTVELSNEAIIDSTTVGPATWINVPVIMDVDDGTLGGTVNMALFPGTTTFDLVNGDSGADAPDPNQVAAFNFNNAPDTFTINANALDQNGHDFNVLGVLGASTLTVNYSEVEHSDGNFSSTNYDTVNINLNLAAGDGPDADSTFYGDALLFEANNGDAETVNLSYHPVDGDDVVTIGDDVNHVAQIGHSTITLLGGTFAHPTTGTLNISGTGEVELGVTNASVINDTSTHPLDMAGPDSNIAGTLFSDLVGGVTVTADGAGSTLQGSLGVLTFADVGGVNSSPFSGMDNSGAVANDTLTDLAGHTNFFGDGGSDTINMGGGDNTAHFGEFNVDGVLRTQTITDANDGNTFQGFWGNANGHNNVESGVEDVPGGTSADVTTINGFVADTVGSITHDTLQFNVDAWADGITGDGSLVESNGKDIVDAGNAIFGVIAAPGATLAGGETNIVAYSTLNPIADADELAQLIHGAGSFNFAGGLAGGSEVHMLVAYGNETGGVTIADVEFEHESGSSTNTKDMDIHASDMVILTGVSLSDLVAHPNDIAFVTH